MDNTTNTKIALFETKQIRKIIHNDEWWFVIVDVVSALTDSIQPAGYIKDMRRRDPELLKGWRQIATLWSELRSLKLNCANTAGIFRIIQSIPSPKASHLSYGLPKLAMKVSEYKNTKDYKRKT